MSARAITGLYNTAARLWLVAAAGSLLLPPSTRLGFWLPLHLALAGAASTAISGNMMAFAAALTATRGATRPAALVQFALVTAGAATIAYGYPHARPGIVAAGGACFLVAIAMVGGVLWSAWHQALNRRHAVPMAMYAVSVASVLAGGSLGALLGSGVVRGPAFAGMRDAHLTLNVLGWASVTIVGTLITLLPTVLRIRVPAWSGVTAGACMAGGLAALALGLIVGDRVIAVTGGILYLAAAVHLAVMVARGFTAPRRWPAPVAAKHMAAAVAWFVCGVPALVVAVARGAFDPFVPVLELIFVCGWILQTLIGSLLYLVPVGRPGPPGERRVWFTAMDVGANAQVVAANVGLAVVVLARAGLLPGAAGRIGTAGALAAAAAALAKSWLYPLLARVPAIRRRSVRTWAMPQGRP